VIDTGGYIREVMTFWLRNRKQVELAIDEADVIIFVVDVEGITPMDDAVAVYCVKLLNPVLLVVNKVDNA
jgi:GTP-binding protein